MAVRTGAPNGFDRPATSAALTGTIRITASATSPAAADHEGRVEEHADRNEEHAREDVAQRTKLTRNLVADVRLTDEQSGQECAERQR